MPRITVYYFAVLREQRGESAEVIETFSETPGALYCELQSRHDLSLPLGALRCAVNDEFASMDQKLKDNDSVAFIAPVAGG
jgi:molybdopterin converting factor small subunit